MENNIRKNFMRLVPIFFAISVVSATVFANSDMQEANAAVKIPFLKKALLTSPKGTTLVTSKHLEVTWTRNAAIALKLSVFDYTHNKSVYYGSVGGMGETVFNLPSSYSKLRVVLYSYDAHGRYLGYDRVLIHKKTSAAHLLEPKINEKLKSNSMTVTWKQNLAENVVLYIHDYKQQKILHYDIAHGTTKTFFNLGSHSGKLLVLIYSFDAEGNYLGQDRRYVFTQD